MLVSIFVRFIEKAEFFQQTTLQLPSAVSPMIDQSRERTLHPGAVLLAKSEDVAINIDESQPLIAKQDPVITIHTATVCNADCPQSFIFKLACGLRPNGIV